MEDNFEFDFTIEEKRELQKELFYKIGHYERWLNDDERTDKEEIQEKLKETKKEYEKLSDEIKAFEVKRIANYLEFQKIYNILKETVFEFVKDISKESNYFLELLEENVEPGIEKITDEITARITNKVIKTKFDYTTKEFIRTEILRLLEESNIYVIEKYKGTQPEQIEQYLKENKIKILDENISQLATQIFKSHKVTGTKNSIRVVLDKIKNNRN